MRGPFDIGVGKIAEGGMSCGHMETFRINSQINSVHVKDVSRHLVTWAADFPPTCQGPLLLTEQEKSIAIIWIPMYQLNC